MAWGEANEPEHGSLGSRRCAACTTQAVAFALDLEALDVAQSTDVEVRTELLSASLSRESNYGSASFQPVVMQKLRALQQLLLEGKTVFFLDHHRSGPTIISPFIPQTLANTIDVVKVFSHLALDTRIVVEHQTQRTPPRGHITRLAMAMVSFVEAF